MIGYSTKLGGAIIMDYIKGISNGEDITTLPYPIKQQIAQECAYQMAKMHHIAPPKFSPTIMNMGTYIDEMFHMIQHLLQKCSMEPHYYHLILAIITKLKTYIMHYDYPCCICHGDFRTGNYLVEKHHLTAILDIEFIHIGLAIEDIAWFTCPIWRYKAPYLHAGGLTTKADFLALYYQHTSIRFHADDLRFFDIIAYIRWVIIAHYQQQRYENQIDKLQKLQSYKNNIKEWINDITHQTTDLFS